MHKNPKKFLVNLNLLLIYLLAFISHGWRYTSTKCFVFGRQNVKILAFLNRFFLNAKLICIFILKIFYLFTDDILHIFDILTTNLDLLKIFLYFYASFTFL